MKKQLEIEEKNENIISLREEDEEEENIEEKKEYSLKNGENDDNSYLNGIKETPTFMNKYIDIKNREENINENEPQNKNDKENIFLNFKKRK